MLHSLHRLQNKNVKPAGKQTSLHLLPCFMGCQVQASLLCSLFKLTYKNKEKWKLVFNKIWQTYACMIKNNSSKYLYWVNLNTKKVKKKYLNTFRVKLINLAHCELHSCCSWEGSKYCKYFYTTYVRESFKTLYDEEIKKKDEMWTKYDAHVNFV